MGTPDRSLTPGDPKAFSLPMRHDDPFARTRTVPLKVLVLGLSRTGTYAMRQALLQLGYDDCYHFTVPLQESPRDWEMFEAALAAKYEGRGKAFGRQEWDALFGNYMAITDSPGNVFYRELLTAYPEAKVILTVRDSPEEWHKSYEETILKFVDHCYGSSWRDRIWRWFLPKSSLDRSMDILLKYYISRPSMSATERMEYYSMYNHEIERLVPKDNLLIMNVKEGWAPLCQFLGHDEPKTSFPRGNDKVVFMRNTRGLVKFLNLLVMLHALKIGGYCSMPFIAAWVYRYLSHKK